MQSHTDVYPSEHLVVCGDDYTCVITSDKLYQTMMLLLGGEKEVVMLEFWYGWTERQIARHCKVTTRPCICSKMARVRQAVSSSG